ncbi:hypothetical protein Tco_0630524 [Tanacetum coccineum]
MTLSHPAWFRCQRVQGYPVKDSGLGSSCVQHVKQIKPSRRMAMVASGPGTQNLRDGPGLRQFFSSELEFVPDEFSGSHECMAALDLEVQHAYPTSFKLEGKTSDHM